MVPPHSPRPTFKTYSALPDEFIHRLARWRSSTYRSPTPTRTASLTDAQRSFRRHLAHDYGLVRGKSRRNGIGSFSPSANQASRCISRQSTSHAAAESVSVAGAESTATDLWRRQRCKSFQLDLASVCGGTSAFESIYGAHAQGEIRSPRTRESHQPTRAVFQPHFGFDRAADSSSECARHSRGRLVLSCDAVCSNRDARDD
jgi:hypothetical protein